MSDNHPPQQKKPSWPGASLALFILGLCILVPSGLCTTIAIVVYPFGILVFLMALHFPLAGWYYGKVERLMGVDPFESMAAYAPRKNIP